MIRLSAVYFSLIPTAKRPQRESPQLCRRKKIVEAVVAPVADCPACHSLPKPSGWGALRAIKPPPNHSSVAVELDCSDESCKIRHYFIGEKSVGRMKVKSTFSTSLLACSDFITS
jgi:hypothetical protein